MKRLKRIPYFIISTLILHSAAIQPISKGFLPEKANIKTMCQSGCATATLFVGLVVLKNYRAHKEYERKQSKIAEANALLDKINNKIYWQWNDADKQLAKNSVDTFEREYARYQELLGTELQVKWGNFRTDFDLYHETYEKNMNIFSPEDFRRLRSNLWSYQNAVGLVAPKSPELSQPYVFGALGFIVGGLGYLAAIKYLFT